MIALEYILLGAASLLLLSIIVSKASGKLGVPVLLLFLVLGMLAGSDGPGGIYFDNARIAQGLGVVALVFILFAGGLSTEWARMRPVLWSGISLSTIGVFITGFLVGAFAHFVLKFTWIESLLIGSIISCTDAAAVFSVLRSRNARLKGKLEPLLELESGSNDPMAVFLTISLTELLMIPATPAIKFVPMFFLQMGLGAAFGYGMGKAMIMVINRLKLEYEGLYPVLTLSSVIFTYGATTALHGNGFLAAYIAGVVLGNSDFIHKKSLMRFHDGLSWLMQITMFLTLGLLVFPKRLIPIIGVGLLMSLFLIFIARPLSVFLSLLLAKLSIREKAMISWVGLRGAAPIILATFPMLAGAPRADLYFHIVFFIVLTSSLLQGTTIPLVARRLGVDSRTTEKRRPPLEYEPAGTTRDELVEMQVPRDSAVVGRMVLELGLPPGSLIVLLTRGDETIVPAGGTVIEADDELLVFAGKDDLKRIEAIIG